MKVGLRRIVGVATAVGMLGVTMLLWQAVFAAESDGLLRVSFLNVGQGDAIFIVTPSNRQVLVDGGSGRSVMRQLGSVMPWHDRTIDVVVATHPDTDHIGGLVDVLTRYDVSYIIRSGVMNDTPAAEAFARGVAQEGAEEITAKRGQRVVLGDGVFLDILFPDRDVSRINMNSGSVIAKLVYGSTSFLLTGDAPQSIEEYVVSLDGEMLKSDVLKVGHHGSKTSSSALFVGFVSPKQTVISRGCNNRYGHPHREVVDALDRFAVEVFDTCLYGTVTFVSDGNNVWESK